MRRTGGERGATLVELLVAMAMGGLVIAALLQVYVTSLRSDARTEDRVSATARARLGAERVTTALTSQVCLDAVTPPIKPGSTANVLTFYSDPQTPSTTTTPTANGVRLERLTYDAATRTILDDRWPGSTETGTPVRRTLAQDVLVAPGDSGPFSYFAYNDISGGAAPVADTEQTPAAGTGLTAAQVALTVRVRVDVVARTTRTKAVDGRSVALGGDAYVQSLDPLQPELGARCTA